MEVGRSIVGEIERRQVVWVGQLTGGQMDKEHLKMDPKTKEETW